MYKLIFTDRALKSLKAIPRKDAAKIIEQLEELAVSPLTKSNVKCLKNHPLAIFRLRVGDYRIIFNKYTEIEIVEVIDLGHRKDIYE
jgi:mRNA interferase RelE/StbE